MTTLSEFWAWLCRLPRAGMDLLWLWMVGSFLWVLLGRPAASQVIPGSLRLIARTDPDRLRVWLDGQSWTCAPSSPPSHRSPSQPWTPGDTAGLAPLGRHAGLQPSEPGDRYLYDNTEEGEESE